MSSPKILKNTRRRKIKGRVLRVFFLFLIFTVVVISGVVYVFYIDKFKIKEVVINGEFILSEKDLRSEIDSVLTSKVLGLASLSRTFYFPKEKITANLLDKFERLEDVKIEKEFPSTILIDVTERTPVAILCLENSSDCFFLDKTAFIFEPAPLFSSGVYLKFFDMREQTNPEEKKFLLDQENFNRLLLFKKQLEDDFQASEIHLKNEGVYEIYMNDWYLILYEQDDWNLLYNNFMAFYKNLGSAQDIGDLEYVDLRFGKKVFFKWK